jgi:hypothetical protein
MSYILFKFQMSVNKNKYINGEFYWEPDSGSESQEIPAFYGIRVFI